MSVRLGDNMDNRPIGVFDSGLGGLTAVKALRELMPNENIIYFADSARVPYGSRPVGQLRKMAQQDMELVASFGVKAMIAACGTVSSNAADMLKAFDVPVFGVLEPGTTALCDTEGNGPLGIIATEASIRSGSFTKAAETLCPGREIIGIPCPDFVTLIESGHSKADEELLCEAVERYLKPLKEAGAAALLLGCTHYGIIAEAIENYLGKQVKLVSAARSAAEALCGYINENGLCGGEGKTEYYTSGRKEDFDAAAGLFLGGDKVSCRQLEAMEVD